MSDIFAYGSFYFTIESSVECRVGSNSCLKANGAIDGTQLSGKVVIPQVVFDENRTSYFVRGIGNQAFRECTKVKEFVLPNLSEMSTAAAAIGYREAVWYYKGLCTYKEMAELLKRNTRRYAKRQLTWLRKNKEVNWLDYKDSFNQATELIDKKGF